MSYIWHLEDVIRYPGTNSLFSTVKQTSVLYNHHWKESESVSLLYLSLIVRIKLIYVTIHGSNLSKISSILPDRLLLRHSPETSAVLHSNKRQTLKWLKKMYPPLDVSTVSTGTVWTDSYAAPKFLVWTTLEQRSRKFSSESLTTKWKNKGKPYFSFKKPGCIFS